MALTPPKLDYAAPDRTGRGAVEMLEDAVVGGAMIVLGVAAVGVTLALQLALWSARTLIRSEPSDFDTGRHSALPRDGWRRIVGRPLEPPAGRR